MVAGMGNNDERMRLEYLIRALWSEDEDALRAKMRELGMEPRLVELGSGEELLYAVALYVRLARRKGWPTKDAGAVMVWAWRQRHFGGPEALQWERRQRDSRPPPPDLGEDALAAAGVRGVFALTEEEKAPDFNAQMDALDEIARGRVSR